MKTSNHTSQKDDTKQIKENINKSIESSLSDVEEKKLSRISDEVKKRGEEIKKMKLK